MANRPGQRSSDTSDLRSYFLAVFTGEAGPERMYKQRSMLVTHRVLPSIKKRVEDLMAQIREMGYPEWEHRLFEHEEIRENKRPSGITPIPKDPTIFAINDTPIVLARKSPATGEVYHNSEFSNCPKSGRKLIPTIQSKNE